MKLDIRIQVYEPLTSDPNPSQGWTADLWVNDEPVLTHQGLYTTAAIAAQDIADAIGRELRELPEFPGLSPEVAAMFRPEPLTEVPPFDID